MEYNMKRIIKTYIEIDNVIFLLLCSEDRIFSKQDLKSIDYYIDEVLENTELQEIMRKSIVEVFNQVKSEIESGADEVQVVRAKTLL